MGFFLKKCNLSTEYKIKTRMEDLPSKNLISACQDKASSEIK
jgi:hypothetical protein